MPPCDEHNQGPSIWLLDFQRLRTHESPPFVFLVESGEVHAALLPCQLSRLQPRIMCMLLWQMFVQLLRARIRLVPLA